MGACSIIGIDKESDNPNRENMIQGKSRQNSGIYSRIKALHGVTIRYFISCCPGLGFRQMTVNDSFGVQRSETATFETVISAV